jgi:hypothetical protein
MSLRNSTLWSARALLFLAPASIASAGVHIVDPSGLGNFTSIQPAVDAALEGDVILVRGGTYAAFTIDNKGLAIYADADASVAINGGVAIVNVAAAKTVVLSSLQVTGTANPVSTVALSCTNDAGALRFQKCTFQGGQGGSTANHDLVYPNAAHGVTLTNASNVSFVGCTLQGGNAYNDSEYCYECTGGTGGDGVRAQGSIVALYDSFCTGGTGGETGEYGGQGGTGYRALDHGGFASRVAFKGGKGGNAWDFLYAEGGSGGDALRVEQSAGFHLLSDTYQPGAGGISYLFPNLHGGPGQAIAGQGAHDMLPGIARVFSASALADDGGSISVTVYGQEGDKVYLPQSPRTKFHYVGQLSGVWLLPQPLYFPLDPIAVVPASGIVTFDASLLHLTSDVDAGVAFAQGYVVDTQGVKTLGSPLNTLLMRCAVLAPDCNGNGRFDTCDLFQHLSIDCDANSVPDECQADCNANGVADSCDISSHTSPDANHNGVPDECEPVNATWYVDASAPPGGNGSSSSPFQTIAQGLVASLNGHTVIVRDGIYTGTSNRNLDFGGRDIVVKSANGPANCIIDCQLASRAFTLRSGETSAARIEGLTIKNGSSSGSTFYPGEAGAIHVYNSSPVIENCVFTGCRSTADGGAIFTFNSNALIRDCTFTDNQVPTGGNAAGGAIELVYFAPKVVNCVVSNNVAQRFGGGLAVFSTNGALIESCTIIGNTANQYDGGAVYASGGNVQFDNCLVAGNQASNGGGFAGNGNIVITNSTIVDNKAISRGGGIQRTQGGGGSVVNTILWRNTAANGGQIALMSGGAHLDVAFCDVQGGQVGVAIDAGAVLNWNAGNIAVDPAFVDADGPDDNALTVGDNDYRLSLASPCIDAGDDNSIAADFADLDGDGDTSEPIPFDLGLFARFVDIASVPDTGNGVAPIVDIGAYERQP